MCVCACMGACVRVCAVVSGEVTKPRASFGRLRQNQKNTISTSESRVNTKGRRPMFVSMPQMLKLKETKLSFYTQSEIKIWQILESKSSNAVNSNRRTPIFTQYSVLKDGPVLKVLTDVSQTRPESGSRTQEM